jgi:hypothetical protein
MSVLSRARGGRQATDRSQRNLSTATRAVSLEREARPALSAIENCLRAPKTERDAAASLLYS